MKHHLVQILTRLQPRIGCNPVVFNPDLFSQNVFSWLTLHTSFTFEHICHLFYYVARPLAAQQWKGRSAEFSLFFIFLTRNMLEG